MIKILFVCMGNICRSPTAEGVFRARAANQGLTVDGEAPDLYIDSAGTHAYHVGEPPDARAQGTARSRGIDLSDQRARRVEPHDYELFDHILAMDRGNLEILLSESPPDHRRKLSLFLDHAPHLGVAEVPDPYYGGEDGFDHVFDLVEAASDGLIEHLKAHHKIGS